MKGKHNIILVFLFLFGFSCTVFGQKPYRVGTTAATFLEIGMSGAGIGMGDAQVAAVNDLTGMYWNPAGLAHMQRNEAFFLHQPWVVDINSYFAGVGIVIPTLGTLGLSITGVNYGETEVTTMEYQDGTGEKYHAQDIAIGLSYARSIATWFSFGATFKYITSKIWHTNASAFAFDLGVLVNTDFLSHTGKKSDGLRIGMSISNYGTKIQYDGDDLLFPYDQEEDAYGSYERTQGKYKMAEWELPLIFRVGVAFNALHFEKHKLTLAIDALHPNNMAEHVNVGAEYEFKIIGTGDFYLRGGYKALFMEDSEYGPSFGGGVKIWTNPSLGFKVDYAFHSIGILGNVNSFSIGVMF